MHHLRSGGDDGTVRRISVCYVSSIMPGGSKLTSKADSGHIGIHWYII